MLAPFRVLEWLGSADLLFGYSNSSSYTYTCFNGCRHEVAAEERLMLIGGGLGKRLHTGRKDKAATEASSGENGYVRQWEATAVCHTRDTSRRLS